MGPRQLMLINEVSPTSTNRRKDQWRNSAEVRKRTYFVPSKVRPRDYQITNQIADKFMWLARITHTLQGPLGSHTAPLQFLISNS